MKKIITALVFACVAAASAFGQAEERLTGTDSFRFRASSYGTQYVAWAGTATAGDVADLGGSKQVYLPYRQGLSQV